MDWDWLPIALLGVNLGCFLFFIALLRRRGLRQRFFRLPLVVRKLFPVVAVGAVVVAAAPPQGRLAVSNWISIPAGVLLFVAGCLMIGGALCMFGGIPSLRQKSNLVTSGVFRLVRHPIYSGTLIAVLGWAILWRSLALLAYFPLLFALYYVLTVVEERNLVEEYGDEYVAYKRQVTKRLIPFVG